MIQEEGLDPFSAIVPILRLSADGRVKGVAGTGFFVGARPLVITAKHVFLGDPLAEGEQHGMAIFRPDGTVGIGPIENYLVSTNWDIAVFAAGGHPTATCLTLSRTKYPTNHDVLAFEYSSTAVEADETGNITVKFFPITHKGNILRHYVSDFPVKTPTPSFDLSFPALQGASGAPVLRASDWAVVGMLVANVERHLMPAQVVRIDLDGTGHEEVSYFLPTGQAIEATLIIEYLDELGADVNIID